MSEPRQVITLVITLEPILTGPMNISNQAKKHSQFLLAEYVGPIA